MGNAEDSQSAVEVQARCDECGGGTRNHAIITAHKHDEGDDDVQIYVTFYHQVIRCLGCGTFRFREVYYNSEITDDENRAVPRIRVYPEPTQKIRPEHADLAGIRLRCSNRRSEDRQAYGRQRAIYAFRVNAVAIVDHIAMCLVPRHDHPELLRGPCRRRMFRGIPVHDASGAQIEDHENVHQAKRHGHHDEEIARHHGPCVIPDKVVHACDPLLRRGSRRGGRYRRTIRGDT